MNLIDTLADTLAMLLDKTSIHLTKGEEMNTITEEEFMQYLEDHDIDVLVDADEPYISYPEFDPHHLYFTYKITLATPHGIYKTLFYTGMNNITRPTPIEVLQTLTWDCVGSYEDFLDTFGYTEENPLSKKIYKSLMDEYTSLLICFTIDEKEELLDRLSCLN